MRLLVCRREDASSVADALAGFLKKQGYQVVVADFTHTVAAAQAQKLELAFIPSTVDQATETLELMQKLSILGIPSVLINAETADYSAAEDMGLTRILARFPRRTHENGNGHRD